MIRTFDWRDLGLLHRARDAGLCLDSQLAFTRGSNTIQILLLDMITPGRTAFTLVARPDEKGIHDASAIGQILHRPGEPHARLSFIGPVDERDNPSIGRLLDSLGQSAGERGAQHLMADVDEQSPIFEDMRKAGFAIYSRQRIWCLKNTSEMSDPPGPEVWQSEFDANDSAINHLYLNIVPALVQQVEFPPKIDRKDLTYWHEDEILGYLDIERGPLGVWIDPYIHPAVENLDDLLISFLDHYSDSQKRSLFFSVRSYQGWIGHALERLGFEPHSDQAVMVKRLAVNIRRPALSPIPSVEGTRPEPTTPFANIERNFQSPITPKQNGS
jgi:hypothetical protein